MADPQTDDGAFYQPWLDPDRDYAAGEPATSHTGVAGSVEKRMLGTSRMLDRLQANHGVIAFTYAAFKKYADDEGSRLAALLAYYTFMSLFPLAIAGFAVLNTVLVGHPEYVDQLVADIVPPEYQDQVVSAYESLPSGGVALAVALIGLVLAGTAGVFSMYAMVNQVFCVPYRFRYGFGPRYIRVLLMVVLMGLGVLAVTVGSALVANVTGYAFAQRAAASVLIWLVASALLYAAATVLTRRTLTFGEVGLGSALGGLAMTTIIGLGSVLLGRFVTSSSAVYGVFGTVVGIFSVLFLVSNAVVFCFEISVVRAWQLWPRGVDINLLFPADERAYALLALMDERMPSQRNGVAFDASGHDDPRRADLASLMHRPDGVPLHPYVVGDGEGQPPSP
ncbi:MAG TPA: YihY/virulence factor BrkB family protein [Candidatus Limnocylindrales bacterium]|nr:YihY/virulence factor BrkB family protein [Candidatus Limnocylindrales bacterium]